MDKWSLAASNGKTLHYLINILCWMQFLRSRSLFLRIHDWRILVSKIALSRYPQSLKRGYPALQKTLDKGWTGESTFICGDRVQSSTKETFGNYFRRACNEPWINKSANGVRKINATRTANEGATLAQVKSLFGWEADNMASRYTKTADRRRLAREAITKLQKSWRWFLCPHLLIGRPHCKKQSIESMCYGGLKEEW